MMRSFAVRLRRVEAKVPREEEGPRMATGNRYLRGESPLPEGMGSLRVARCVT